MNVLSVILSVAGVALVPLLACPAAGSAGGVGSGRVTILHVNDSHGRHMPLEVTGQNATSQTGDPGGSSEGFGRRGHIGGFAYLASVVEKLRRDRGRDRVLLVHSGDAFSDDLLGNLTEGEATIRLMNALRFDFLALGNHDFDYGQERTRALQEIAKFPMRAANVLDTTTGEPYLGDPTTVHDVHGLRVGLLALGYHSTHLTTDPDNVPTLKFISGIEAARQYVPRLAGRVDLVVVVSHLGAAVDRKLAREVDGIDLIVGGHSHDTLAAGEEVRGTWIVQASSDLTVLGEVTITMKQRTLERVEVVHHPLWNDQYEPDRRVNAIVEALRRPYREKLEEVLAKAGRTIGRNYKSESPFDVLVANVLREETGADVAMLPGIGYGVSLTPGPITREQLYTLLPHPARVATVRLTGAQIRAILEQSAANVAPDDPEQAVGGLVQTAGMEWTADLTKPVGCRIADVTVGGASIDTSRHYLVATHGGMLKGIHRYEAFQQGREAKVTERKLHELVETRLREMAVVHPPTLGAVRLIQ